ncbi:F-box/LRR-repeat protein 15-like [Elysia marginata]|uniref:F-box/LRR-repeat protein 15-like n=1 Tax=Elysia marginata TaxID=1093978 RepID=A0AAV4F784_9GAST|nr:F-box/LRR-repeat protein 15-like [Elysia marginata]
MSDPEHSEVLPSDPEYDIEALSFPDSEDVLDNQVTLLDLPWEQVLCSHILPFLSTKDLFYLRSVSRGCQALVQTHFHLQFHVNTNSLGDRFTPEAFWTMTKDSACLRTLCLRGAKSWLTSDILLPVIAANPRLEKVDLTGCLALSGAVVYSIGVKCKSLHHLCLENCVGLVLDNFLSFMQVNSCLEFLDISGCWNLDDDLVVQLVPFMPKLKHLLLANLYGLTDRSIVAIAHACPNLIHLSIRGCWRVTDGAIK